MKTVSYPGSSLDYLTVYPDGFREGAAYPLVICLHGFGADMHDLADLAPLLDPASYLYVLPNGPLAAFGEPTTRAWHERGGNESPGAVRDALAALDGFVKEVSARYRIDRALLLGFSQGGAMALRYGVPRPDLFAGLAVLSGSLRRVAELRADMPAERKQAIFVAHGLNDPLVPIEWSRALVSLLEEDGYQPVYKTYPIGHEISPAEMADLKKWIGSVLPPLP